MIARNHAIKVITNRRTNWENVNNAHVAITKMTLGQVHAEYAPVVPIKIIVESHSVKHASLDNFQDTTDRHCVAPVRTEHMPT